MRFFFPNDAFTVSPYIQMKTVTPSFGINIFIYAMQQNQIYAYTKFSQAPANFSRFESIRGKFFPFLRATNQSSPPPSIESSLWMNGFGRSKKQIPLLPWVIFVSKLGTNPPFFRILWKVHTRLPLSSQYGALLWGNKWPILRGIGFRTTTITVLKISPLFSKLEVSKSLEAFPKSLSTRTELQAPKEWERICWKFESSLSCRHCAAAAPVSRAFSPHFGMQKYFDENWERQEGDYHHLCNLSSDTKLNRPLHSIWKRNSRRAKRETKPPMQKITLPLVKWPKSA